MDVEFGRILSAESGPDWQQKVTAAARAGHTVSAPSPYPSPTASESEFLIALEVLRRTRVADIRATDARYDRPREPCRAGVRSAA